MKGFIVLLLLLVASVAQAEAYRWVDENGQTHFGDRPPANAVSSEVQLEKARPAVDAAVSERKQRMSEFVEQSEKERAVQKQARAEQEALAAEREARCEDLVARMKYLERVSRLYRLNKDGERVYVNDEENEQIRKEFRAHVQSECDI
ncbi:DUF4124 domain-containing protein [Marinobacter sp. F3R11]|uniref:DUF4124 domain-containing protein n=1 Tax=Marinobacter sp. F3R11 TaxID=2267231 RepID=UPI000DE9DA6B|nr:DUF4124 domain-containing protein [Marinobacter sp. F3R11]RBW50290.1 DUF4124 domain-containing protein [Marinobacter sp. F3R11]